MKSHIEEQDKELHDLLNKIEPDDLQGICLHKRESMGILQILRACLIIKGYDSPIKSDVENRIKIPK